MKLLLDRSFILKTIFFERMRENQMSANMDQFYNERLNRYLAAMRNEKPDKIPIRPFVAEFTAKYAGLTSQDVTHDFNKAFIAVRKCATDFDWDAVVTNMVYVWTGLTQALGIKYYGVPGIDVPPNSGFQYREPAEVRQSCKKVIDEVAKDGGYIMDASAILQNDTKTENLKALTDFTREYGVYSSGSSISNQSNNKIIPAEASIFGNVYGMSSKKDSKILAGICIPWEEKRKEIPEISGDEEISKTVWEDIESLGNIFIWQCLLSF